MLWKHTVWCWHCKVHTVLRISGCTTFNGLFANIANSLTKAAVYGGHCGIVPKQAPKQAKEEQMQEHMKKQTKPRPLQAMRSHPPLIALQALLIQLGALVQQPLDALHWHLSAAGVRELFHQTLQRCAIMTCVGVFHQTLQRNTVVKSIHLSLDSWKGEYPVGIKDQWY